jgi:hypothetical protein
MTRLGPGSRMFLCACAYVSVASVVIAGAFFATLALTPGESSAAARPQTSVEKIGPGYARMKPINLGKPDKIANSTPYYPHLKTSRAASIKRKRAVPIVLAESPAATTAAAMIAVADGSHYSVSDTHRVY